MLEQGRIDIPEGIDVNETNLSKKMWYLSPLVF